MSITKARLLKYAQSQKAKGEWITINGTHVKVDKQGDITNGPEALKKDKKGPSSTVQSVSVKVTPSMAAKKKPADEPANVKVGVKSRKSPERSKAPSTKDSVSVKVKDPNAAPREAPKRGKAPSTVETASAKVQPPRPKPSKEAEIEAWKLTENEGTADTKELKADLQHSSMPDEQKANFAKRLENVSGYTGKKRVRAIARLDKAFKKANKDYAERDEPRKDKGSEAPEAKKPEPAKKDSKPSRPAPKEPSAKAKESLAGVRDKNNYDKNRRRLLRKLKANKPGLFDKLKARFKKEAKASLGDLKKAVSSGGFFEEEGDIQYKEKKYPPLPEGGRWVTMGAQTVEVPTKGGDKLVKEGGSKVYIKNGTIESGDTKKNGGLKGTKLKDLAKKKADSKKKRDEFWKSPEQKKKDKEFWENERKHEEKRKKELEAIAAKKKAMEDHHNKMDEKWKKEQADEAKKEGDRIAAGEKADWEKRLEKLEEFDKRQIEEMKKVRDRDGDGEFSDMVKMAGKKDPFLHFRDDEYQKAADEGLIRGWGSDRYPTDLGRRYASWVGNPTRYENSLRKKREDAVKWDKRKSDAAVFRHELESDKEAMAERLKADKKAVDKIMKDVAAAVDKIEKLSWDDTNKIQQKAQAKEEKAQKRAYDKKEALAAKVDAAYAVFADDPKDREKAEAYDKIAASYRRATSHLVKKDNALSTARANARRAQYAPIHKLISHPRAGKGQSFSGAKLLGQKKDHEFLNKMKHHEHPLSFAAGFVGKDTFERINSRLILDIDNKKNFRASATSSEQNGRGALNMSSTAAPRAWAHEIGHVIETHGGLTKQAQTFLDRRAKGEKVRPLKKFKGMEHYAKDEKGRQDKFINAYIGKHYVSGHTEVLSMGMEYLYTNPVDFFKKDPDMFKFVVAAMRSTK